MPIKDPVKRREAHSKYMREVWYPKNKVKHKKSVGKNKKQYKQQCRDMISEFRKNGCLLCEEKTPCCLSAHHVDSETKDVTVAFLAASVQPKKLKKELAKCVCLCENCHRKVHAGLLNFDARK